MAGPSLPPAELVKGQKAHSAGSGRRSLGFWELCCVIWGPCLRGLSLWAPRKPKPATGRTLLSCRLRASWPPCSPVSLRGNKEAINLQARPLRSC